MTTRAVDAPARRIGPEEAAALVRSGMILDYAGGMSQPEAFDAALATRKDELSRIRVRGALITRPIAVLDADPKGEHFHYTSLHCTGYERAKCDAGTAHYLPINLGEVPDYYRRFLEPGDIFVLKARPMDESGTFNFGPTNSWLRSVIETAKVVIVEESAGLPYAHGVDNGVHVSEVDYVIPGNDAPPAGLLNPLPTDVDRAVGRLIAAEVEDGACLQIGIGGMPNAVCAMLVESGVRDLGIHTEMVTDGIVDLYKSGQVTGSRKQIDPGKMVGTFAFGARTMYEAIDGNPDFHFCAADYTNLPHMIMQNDNMVAINNTTQVDLQGQAASESDGFRHISGTGGQLQFVRGAYASKGGKAFICLASTYAKRGARRSRIVLTLTKGNIVTTPRTDMMYVVTEYGIVNLKGKCVPDRAKSLIAIAHPDFREELEREAYENGVIPRGFY